MNRYLTTTILSAVLIGLLSVASPVAAADPPPAPQDIELEAGHDNSITISWEASAGATGYRVYRGTASGGEGATPIATVTTTSYKDTGLSSTPIYYYQVTAVNAAGESPRSEEDASKTPLPIGTGGNVPGVADGNSLVFYCKDALLDGFEWFKTLSGWFPSTLGSSGSASPGQRVVDMAYAEEGSMTFNNVVVPTAGLYTVGWRYAFQGGLFPGVNNRKMGLVVNGTVITRTQSFPITGSFDVYQISSLTVQLRAGVNSISQIAVSDHGLSRVDQLIVTPATAPVPTGPSSLRATAADKSVALNWTAGSGATSYSVYRGTKSDGEAVTPIATVTGTAFTDTGLTNGREYFYHVQAFNTVGGSALSNEVSAIPVAGGATAPAAPTGLNAVPGNGSVAVSWAGSAGATSYSVYRATAPGGQGTTPVGTVTGTSFTDTGLTNGTRYYYKVRAANAVGSSGLSAEVSAVPGTTGTPPGVPFGVVITPRTGNILLQWGFMSAATGYNVYRSTSPGAETLLIHVTSPTHIDTAVTPGVTYYYQFTATNGGGESARTAEFPATAR
jgi:fibronectin type 3 domain-containing protein